jgi:hypothetical protein
MRKADLKSIIKYWGVILYSRLVNQVKFILIRLHGIAQGQQIKPI